MATGLRPKRICGIANHGTPPLSFIPQKSVSRERGRSPLTTPIDRRRGMVGILRCRNVALNCGGRLPANHAETVRTPTVAALLSARRWVGGMIAQGE